MEIVELAESGSALRRRRQELDLKQQDVATAARIDKSRYNKIERGKVRPSMLEIERIAQVLGVIPRLYLGEYSNVQYPLEEMLGSR